jgi:hypothetical protein
VDPGPLGQHLPEVDGALPPALEADDHQPPARRQQADVLLQVLRTDRVQDQIDAAVVGDLAYAGRPVLAVGQHVVGAAGPAELQLLGRPGRGDDGRPEVLGVGNGERPDPAGPAVHQHPLAGGQPGVRQVGLDGRRDLDQPGRGDQVDARRRGHHLPGRGHGVRRVAAAGQ